MGLSAPHPHREPRSPWPAARRPTRRSSATEPCTSNEAQPLGQDVGGLGLDEDLAAVERDAGPQLPAHVKHGWFLGVRREQCWGVLGTTLRTTPSYGALPGSCGARAGMQKEERSEAGSPGRSPTRSRQGEQGVGLLRAAAAPAPFPLEDTDGKVHVPVSKAKPTAARDQTGPMGKSISSSGWCSPQNGLSTSFSVIYFSNVIYLFV